MSTPEDTKSLDATLNRQMYALGKETQLRIMQSNVLVIGLRGLGAELAKNLILMGVKGVTLCDSNAAELSDLSSQFFLAPSDVGKPRATACVDRFRELSFAAAVSVADRVDAALIARHTAVVLTGGDIKQATEVDRLCRSAPTKPAFLWADVRGVFGFLFNDFGDNFVVHDPNGEQPLTYMVSNVTQDSAGGVVSVVEETRVEFQVGDRVSFSGIEEGMTDLCKPESEFTVKEVTGKFEFRISADTSAMPAFTGSAYATEVKTPKEHHFNRLEESVVDPGTIEPSDFAKDGRQYLLLLAFRALWKFADSHSGAAPRVHNSDDAAELVRIVHELNAALPEARRIKDVDEAVVRALSFVARGDVSPMDTFIGGVLCQEVLKACSGKFTPIKQWFFFDAMEALPDEKSVSPAEFQPIGSRYDAQIAVFGKAIQERLEGLKYFVVGAGAIGCEVLKVWAMMGLAAGRGGMIHVTDMDTIERSNLSRQFLFREADIEKLKSKVAADAIKKMNPSVNITSYALRVGRESEGVYNEDFYASLDGVFTALDNVAARRYVDMQCVTHRKPMIDSGTLGPKGSTQVVVPFLTESYSSSSDPPEKGIPQCTLHHFPNAIEHTIQWARDLFQGLFTSPAEYMNSYATQMNFMEQLDAQMGLKLKTLQELRDDLVTDRPRDMADCIRWARMRFEELFVHNIQKLVFTFPPDAVTAEGVPFWHPPKKCPHPLQFSIDDPMHISFVEAAANLRAYNYGIATRKLSPSEIAEATGAMVIPAFQPQKIAVDTGDKKEEEKAPAPDTSADDEAQCAAIVKELPPPSSLKDFVAHPAAFEKDDDTNFHVAFVTACSNLRAINYKIPTADFQKTKFIAGKIIPAMISTTAVVSGLQCLELIKTLLNKPLSAYKNSFIHLALPLFTFSEPIAAPKVTVREGWSWTLWDRIEIKGDVTLQEFIDVFKTKYKLDVSMLSCGKSLVYSAFLAANKRAIRLKQKMTAIVEEITKEKIDPQLKSIQFVVCCSRLEDDADADIPPVHLLLH